mmetsp:Transcript_2535/g.4605  ORF Transcript_2535/g.4605 Transcript_2535/m.4605 type:complete len:97 (+) Transcript_2535:371-661(+)
MKRSRQNWESVSTEALRLQRTIVSKYSIVVLDKEGKVFCDLHYDAATKPTFPDQVVKSADSIIHHSGLSVQQDLKVWELDEEPKPVSKYCENFTIC